MTYKIAKLLLEHANTFLERSEAVKSAMRLGMPLHEIEQYLDWLDAMRETASDGASGGEEMGEGGHQASEMSGSAGAASQELGTNENSGSPDDTASRPEAAAGEVPSVDASGATEPPLDERVPREESELTSSEPSRDKPFRGT